MKGVPRDGYGNVVVNALIIDAGDALDDEVEPSAFGSGTPDDLD